VQESRPGAMNDIIEFHDALIPACARPAFTVPRELPGKVPTLRSTVESRVA